MFRNIKSFPQHLNITGCERKTIAFGTLRAFASTFRILEPLRVVDLHSITAVLKTTACHNSFPRKSPDLPSTSLAWKPVFWVPSAVPSPGDEFRMPQTSRLPLARGQRVGALQLCACPSSGCCPALFAVWKGKIQRGTKLTGPKPPCSSLQRMGRLS